MTDTVGRIGIINNDLNSDQFFFSVYQSGFPNKYFGVDAMNDLQKSISSDSCTLKLIVVEVQRYLSCIPLDSLGLQSWNF
jgi:hypothetical protein